MLLVVTTAVVQVVLSAVAVPWAVPEADFRVVLVPTTAGPTLGMQEAWKVEWPVAVVAWEVLPTAGAMALLVMPLWALVRRSKEGPSRATRIWMPQLEETVASSTTKGVEFSLIRLSISSVHIPRGVL